MAGRRAEATAETRRRLIAAAAQLISEVGPHATSIQAVAELSGISRGSITWHFGSKEGLITVVFEDVFASTIEQVREFVETGVSGNTVEKLVIAHGRITEGEAGKIVARSLADVLHGSSEISEVYLSGINSVREAYVSLLEGSTWPDGTPLPPEAVADLILDCGLGINVRTTLNPNADRDARFEELGRIFGIACEIPERAPTRSA